MDKPPVKPPAPITTAATPLPKNMTSPPVIPKNTPRRAYGKKADLDEGVDVTRFPYVLEPYRPIKGYIECLHVGTTANPHLLHLDHARLAGKKSGPFTEQYLYNVGNLTIIHISKNELTVADIREANAPARNNRVTK
jgi:hypothetical protein